MCYTYPYPDYLNSNDWMFNIISKYSYTRLYNKKIYKCNSEILWYTFQQVTMILNLHKLVHTVTYKLHPFFILFVNACFHSWFGILFWGFMLLQHYFSHIATWKQEIPNLWNCNWEIQAPTRTPCPLSQELNHYTTAGPYALIVTQILTYFKSLLP